ncbi:MAG: diaminopimelate decarboxylase [Candidatus Omnitrophica bacterium]|nr:diaminopimelate decarboxylase [Candidatus Omnitrophota bacterium]
MHDFRVRDGQLHCEAVPVLEAAERFGTPLYLYSHHTLIDHFRKLRAAFAPVTPLICFAMKANSNLAICRALIREGAGADIVSVGELRKALLVGAPPSRIVYASVGKTAAEITAAVRAGIFCFNVESAPELEQIDLACRRLKTRQRVSLRLNPNVDPHTHTFISTGRGTDKFGLDEATVLRLFADSARYAGVDLAGVHIHIGSQITAPGPFLAALHKALTVIRRANRRGARIRWLNLGGGLGIVYHREKPQTAAAFAKVVLPLLKGRGLRLILEPGRFIVGNSGILVTRVVYIKDTGAKRFAIVDAGMNDLLRPTLYGAYHDIVPVAPKPGQTAKTQRYDVVGPICESGDRFAADRPLPPLAPGDLLAVMGAGAYGFAMASNYNARPRAAEALVMGRRIHLVRRRETFQDLVRGERIPAALR